MTTMQYKTKESRINYSNTRTDGGNKGVKGKQRYTCRK